MAAPMFRGENRQNYDFDEKIRNFDNELCLCCGGEVLHTANPRSEILDPSLPGMI